MHSTARPTQVGKQPSRSLFNPPLNLLKSILQTPYPPPRKDQTLPSTRKIPPQIRMVPSWSPSLAACLSASVPKPPRSLCHPRQSLQKLHSAKHCQLQAFKSRVVLDPASLIFLPTHVSIRRRIR